MNGRCLTTWFTAIVAVLLVPADIAGQTQGAAVDSWTPSRTAWDDPDLQGDWSFATITPLERPGEYAGRERLTDDGARRRRSSPGVPASGWWRST